MRVWIVVAMTLAMGACSGGESKAPDPAPAPAVNDWKLPSGANPALTNPSLASETAPEQFKVAFETTKGRFVVQVNRAWSPNGADRLYNLVKIGFFDQAKFFRAVQGFMVQFGISGYPEVSKHWQEATIADDPVVESNTRGRMTFAKTGQPNSRSTQLFISYGNNSFLDRDGFSPFGEVVEGMDVVDKLFTGYGEGAPRGGGPDQMRVQSKGNIYLEASFADLDGIIKATVIP